MTSEGCFLQGSSVNKRHFSFSEMDSEDHEKIQAALFQAAAQGDIQLCHDLHTQHQMTPHDLNMRHNSFTPLTCAAQAGHLEVIKWLLNHGADINRPDGRGRTPLFCALTEGNHSIMEFLLKNGCSVDVQSLSDSGLSFPRTHSCLRHAVKHRDLTSLQLLVNYGCNVNESCGDTALHLACKMGNSNAVRLLLDAGADVNSSVLALGFTPLHVAVTSNNPELVEILAPLTKKWAVGLRGQSPVHLAASSNNAAAIRILAAHGWNIDAYSHQGDFPLMTAALKIKVDAFRALIECGCLLDQIEVVPPQEEGRHVLHALPSLRGDPALLVTMATLLLEAGCSVNTILAWSLATPLHVAAEHGMGDLARLYLRHGANPALRNESGLTPLGTALHKPSKDIWQIFFRIGDKVSSVESLWWLPPDASLDPAIFQGPRTLRYLSRQAIRSQMHLPFRKSANSLPLPRDLISFVCMDEVL